jgi:UDP-N-acetylmuramoyl-L-alanyl-D-glutamate--2,6-diaminopimelate ligase
MLNDMLKSGITVVIMEVSAHASKLNKLDAISFFAGVFTNLSLDHLDFFITMENYKNAKLSFLNENRCKYLVVNADDEVGSEILSKAGKVISYGIENPSDVFAINVMPNVNGESFVVNLFDKIYDVNLKVFGKFNVYNALSAMIVCSMLGVPTDKIIEYICTFLGVQGRVERLKLDKKTIFIDYAHTPDGLKQAIDAVKPYATNKLICVFGCGGNRDKEKRKIMGEISANNADFTIITTDNPRFEEPMSIIKEIEKGFNGITDEYVLIEDRRDAIRYALKIANDGDTVLIAGKGGEKYQEVLGIKKPFDDKEIVEEFFKGK